MNKYLLTDEAKKAIALKVFGTSDGFRLTMPRRGESIQDAIDAVAEAQHVKTVELVFERIGEYERQLSKDPQSFVRTSDLQSLKREILEVSNG